MMTRLMLTGNKNSTRPNLAPVKIKKKQNEGKRRVNVENSKIRQISEKEEVSSHVIHMQNKKKC